MYLCVCVFKGESHKMLINFWDNITDNVAVEFSTAAKGKKTML